MVVRDGKLVKQSDIVRGAVKSGGPCRYSSFHGLFFTA